MDAFDMMGGTSSQQLHTAFQWTHDSRLTPGERYVVQQIKHSEEPACYHNGQANPFRTAPGSYVYSESAGNVLGGLTDIYGAPRGY